MLKTKSGFTIVELLIVIVVIGILAAITIVAYNGIQNRARASAASSALTQAAKKIALWQVDNPSSSPSTLATAGVTDTSDVTFQYTPGTNGTYCITATATNVSYKITESTQPTAGGCSGHGQGGVAAVTNMAANPSFETNTTGFGSSSAASIARVTGTAPNGSAYLRINRSAAGDAYAYYTTTGTALASTAYTLSFWIWADTNLTLSDSLLLRVYDNGVCCSNLEAKSGQSVTTTPTRVVLSGTTSANPTTGLQLIIRATPTTGQNIYYDGFMITQGSSAPNYADGNSASWVWNGATNNSTSTGPPL